MVINFFEPNCQTITKAVEFGLCDDPPPPYNVRAYVDVDTINRRKWIASVKNEAQISVTFTAIDACIIIKRPNGEDSKRCDAMLTYQDKIIFVELKQRTGGREEKYIEKVIKEGVDQLTETIYWFSQNYSLNEYRQKTAYVANKLRPNFQFSNTSTIQKFKNDTGFILKTKNTILIS